MPKQYHQLHYHGRPGNSLSRGAFAGATMLAMVTLLLTAAAPNPALADANTSAHPNSAPAVTIPDYRLATTQAGVVPYHPLEVDGWTIIAGSPVQSVRMDYGAFEAGPVVGIWACTTGIIEMSALPYNEFVTVFRGKVVATLDSGEPVELNAGDSFYVPKGSRIRWDIREDVAKYLVIAGTGPVTN
jgi:hypothetical protein